MLHRIAAHLEKAVSRLVAGLIVALVFAQVRAITT